MMGYFAYHAVPTNARALNRFRNRVIDFWRRVLRRRSQKDRTTWATMARLASNLLPKVRILHPWPSDRGSVPDTWVTVYSGDIGNTFGPKGFSIGSSLHVSWSK